MGLYLKEISYDMKDEIMDYRKEFIEHQSSLDGTSGLDNYNCFDEWYEHLQSLKNKESLPEGFVSSSTYVLIANNYIVGMIDIRHELNDGLLKTGGHIGYSVRPSQRLKGYASSMLKLGLDKCREFGINNVLVTCHENNLASKRTIEKNGGVLENSIDHHLRYWITLTPRPIMTIVMQNKSEIVIELYPEVAPRSISSLIPLIQKNMYQNMIIERIVPGFVLQPWYDEKTMPEEFQYVIDGEFEVNGYPNDIEMNTYTVALAGDGKHTSGVGCFYIVVGEERKKDLQGHYAGIGKVISGFDEIERMMQVKTRQIDIGVEGVLVYKPLEDEVIDNIYIDLKGYQPVEVELISFGGE